MVVDGEVVRRQPVRAERRLARPGGGAQAERGIAQLGLGRRTRPEFLEREFELPARADAWKAERCNNDGHDLHTPMKGEPTGHAHMSGTRRESSRVQTRRLTGHPAGGRYLSGQVSWLAGRHGGLAIPETMTH